MSGENGSDDLTVDEMLDNMADPDELQSRKISCPIRGCGYSAMKAESVSGHVSASSQDDHVWANTQFDGWRHFNRVRGDDSETTEQNGDRSTETSSSSTTSTARDEADASKESVGDEVKDVSGLPCPLEGCSFDGRAVEVADHIESKDSHSWGATRFDNRSDFFEFVDSVL